MFRFHAVLASRILGRYIYRKSNLFNELDCSIQLYWGIIWLISSQIGVDIEDLAVVVLAHELAHAYTHIGLDIDGRNWGTESYEHGVAIEEFEAELASAKRQLR